MPFFRGKEMEWVHRRDIKQYLNQYEEKKLTLFETTCKIKEELKDISDNILDSIIEDLEIMAEGNNEERFNDYLEELYTWADNNLVWLGL
jgi:hypothetical protein